MEEKDGFYKVSCNDVTDSELEDKIFCICRMLFEKYRPGEYIPPSSVSIGNIYESTKSKSCQVRFKKNGIIIKVKYSKEDWTFECEVYELTHIKHVYHGYSIKDSIKTDSATFIEYKDYIEDFETPTPPKSKLAKEDKPPKPKKRKMKQLRKSNKEDTQ